jgi:hypothetical protein
MTGRVAEKKQKPFKPVRQFEGLHPVYLALNYVDGRERFSKKVSSAQMQGRSSGFPDPLSAFPHRYPGTVAYGSAGFLSFS